MTLETTTTEAAAPIGHNSGLSDAYELIDRTLRRTDEIEKGASEYLAAENPDLMRRLRDIEATIAAGLPVRLESQAEAEKFSDLRNAVKKWIAAAKLARTGAKKPWDGIAKAFYAFFTRPIDHLETVDAERLGPVLTDWQDREAARKRRDEEERARILRDEADRKMREAAEAETRRLEAERKEREAKEAAERAERDRLAAVEAAAKAKRDREEEERRAVEARERAKREEAERRERDRLAAIAAETAKAERDRLEAEARARREAERQAEEAAAELRRAELKRQEAEAKEAVRKAQEERREAERQAVAARKEIRAETRNESEAVEAAERADKNADKSEERSHAKPADLSRVRGEHGSVSSLRRFYAFRNIERAELDLESLRQHLPIGGLETAVRSYIDAGGTKLRGVEIFEDQTTVTR